jgi:hypothetical protein
VLALVVLLVVLPAFGSNPNAGVPPKSFQGVMPVDVAIGGQPAATICNAFGSSGSSSWDIKNPTPGVYKTTLPGGAKVQATLADSGNQGASTTPAYAADKYLDFTISGAAVVDVGVNGGSDTDDYKYDSGATVTFPPGGQYTNPNPGYVTSDKYLHAPAQSINSSTGQPTQLYSLSHITFCFNTSVTATGTVKVNGTGTSGWTLHLYDGSNKPAGTATSGSGGAYSFSGLAPGSSYTVCAVVPTGYTQTAPTGSNTAPCGGSGTNENPIGRAFTTNQSVTGLDFSYTAPVDQSGLVFNDANHNGSKDGGESGISSTNWTLDLYTSGGSPVTTATTVNGVYTFHNLVGGNGYKVCIVGKSGWTQTLPTGTSSCSGPNESPVGYSFTAGANTNTDFGEAATASISGKAYLDPNGNGTNTSAVGNLAVTLYNSSQSSVVGTTTTDGTTGNYSFGNEFVGDSYVICITNPTDNTYNETKPTSGASCGATGQAPKGYTVNSLASSGVSNLDFGLQGYGLVSGLVYKDNDQDGSNGAGDTGQGGWNVTLYDGTTRVATTQTVSNGSYAFSVLLSTTGNYRVCEAPPASDKSIWAQSEPLPSTQNICNATLPGGATELKKGHTFTVSSPGASVTANTNFGNDPAVMCPPNQMGAADNTDSQSYTIQLAFCKPGQTFIFGLTQGVVDNNPSNVAPAVSVWVGDETMTPKVPLVEKIVFPFAIPAGGTQPVLTLHYDDTFPFSEVGAPTMPFCNFDPRVPGSEFDLQTAYKDHTGAQSVIPSPDTSCLIVQSQSSAAAPGNPSAGIYTAYVYSELDGLRFASP